MSSCKPELLEFRLDVTDALRYPDFTEVILTLTAVDGLSVLTVAGPSRADIFVDVFIAGKSLKFLVDSGSSVSILEESIFKQYFANESLLPAPRVKLLDYSKRCIPVRGCFFTEVTFKGRRAYLLFYVVAEGTSILGTDAITVLDLHIEGSSLHCFEMSTMPATLDAAQLSGSCQVSPTNSLPKTLSSEFGSLFGPGLWFAKGFVHRMKTGQKGPPDSTLNMNWLNTKYCGTPNGISLGPLTSCPSRTRMVSPGQEDRNESHETAFRVKQAQAGCLGLPMTDMKKSAEGTPDVQQYHHSHISRGLRTFKSSHHVRDGVFSAEMAPLGQSTAPKYCTWSHYPTPAELVPPFPLLWRRQR
ncbi:hypothetical protein MTO96_036732 [Rhipicephalus appendiculatus]